MTPCCSEKIPCMHIIIPLTPKRYCCTGSVWSLKVYFDRAKHYHAIYRPRDIKTDRPSKSRFILRWIHLKFDLKSLTENIFVLPMHLRKYALKRMKPCESDLFEDFTFRLNLNLWAGLTRGRIFSLADPFLHA